MNSRAKNIIVLILIWIVTSYIGVYQRLYTLRNHLPHEIEELATTRVILNLRQTIAQQIERKFPDRSPVERQRIAKEQFDLTLRNEKQKVRDAIAEAARQLSERTPSQERSFYLLASDSYYYYNLTQNIVDTGKISEKTKGSKYFNPLMTAPSGYWEPLRIYPYIGYSVYKAISFFRPDVSLMEAVSYTPVILTVFIVLIYLIGCAILNLGPAASFLGAVYFLCIPIFIRRSMFGWYDDDPPNILFLFAILSVFFYGLKNLDRKNFTLACAGALAVLFTFYALFWQGWVFLASIIFLSGALMLIYLRFTERSQIKSIALYLGFAACCIFAGISLIFGPQEFFALFEEGWVALQDFVNPQLSLWPDLYIAVGELLAPKPTQWLEMMGGAFFIGVGLLGLGSRAVPMFIKPKDRVHPSTILLIIFALVGVRLSLGAQRFETLCMIPFAFAFPMGIEFIFSIVMKLKQKFLAQTIIPSFARSFLILSFVVALSIVPFTTIQKKTPELLNKIFNSTWDTVLTKIKNETPPESIINTWWPPGHFIKAVAQRRVTFDGATINKPQSYWIANALLATDERIATGILRMLNVSGNEAIDNLIKQGFKTSEAINLMKSITGLNEDAARQILLTRLTKQQAEDTLSLTHGRAPPSYLLIYNDMAQESLQFKFVGDWDFKKVEAINDDPALLKQVPARSAKTYVPFLWEIAGGAPRYTGLFIPIATQGKTITFENNIRIDQTDMTCRVNSTRFGQGIPQSLLYEEHGEFIEKPLANATLPFSVLLINDKTGPKCMLADRALGNSMLLRLYYFGGKGLKVFEPFVEEQDRTGRTRILVYKINWDKLK